MLNAIFIPIHLQQCTAKPFRPVKIWITFVSVAMNKRHIDMIQILVAFHLNQYNQKNWRSHKSYFAASERSFKPPLTSTLFILICLVKSAFNFFPKVRGGG